MHLLYFSNVWPQTQVSAASHRVFGFIYALMKNGWKVDFISSSKKSKETSELKRLIGVTSLTADPNDIKSTSQILNKLKNKPDIAIFDTFSVEEKFSHYVYRHFPDCMRILDLQDLHSLRMKRGSLLSSQNSNKLCDLQVMKIKSNPQEDSFAARELASMYRSDLVITCSDYEQYILKNYYNIDHTALITFFQTEVDELENRERVNTYDIRRHFAWLGNFNHPPNLDAVGWLVNEAWPKISERIPKAELHLYGSNFRKEFSGLEKENQGIKSMGLMKDLVSLSYYRALLAPLRFGAGIKGKICDAWYYGLPCVTTPIGAEGMFLDTYNNNFDYNTIDLKSQYFKSEESVSQFSSINQELSNYYNYENEPKIEEFDFGGSYLNYNIDDFVENCVKIYNEKTLWEIKSKMGYKIVENRMGFLVNEALFLRKISEALSKLPTTRKKNHIQALTWNETLRSTENLAKYISIKNSTKKN